MNNQTSHGAGYLAETACSEAFAKGVHKRVASVLSRKINATSTSGGFLNETETPQPLYGRKPAPAEKRPVRTLSDLLLNEDEISQRRAPRQQSTPQVREQPQRSVHDLNRQHSTVRNTVSALLRKRD